MLKRNIKITFRLDKSENEYLKKRVKKSGLSQEGYLRYLIKGLLPMDVPPPDYYAMMKQLHHIGTNLNQVAQKAHILNVVDVQRYDDNVAAHNKAVTQIVDAVMRPRKIE